MAIKFTKKQVQTKINQLNTWWIRGEIEFYYAQWEPRKYLELFYPLVIERTVKRAVILMGPRRVGKTVMIHHSISQLIKSSVISPNNICYINIEIPIFNGIGLEEFVQLFLELRNLDTSEESIIFFDEIQYLKDWEIHLKVLVDTYHNIKFIVSGSAAAALKLKSKESGAGRFTDFSLPPLTFYEYLALTKFEKLIIDNQTDEKELPASLRFSTTDIKLLNKKFIEYINFGGYPELSLSKTMREDPARYVKSDIIDKVLLRDLPSLYDIRDTQQLNSLFTYLAYNSGNELSLDELSKNSGVAKNTIKRHLTYLEAAFLIKIIHKVNQNAKKFLRATSFKIYLTNPSLRSALFDVINVDDNMFGHIVETAIFAQWFHSDNENKIFYANWKSGEVDLVYLKENLKPWWCAEIKWSNRLFKKTTDLKKLKQFCLSHKLESALVTTVDIQEHRKIDNVNFEFIPASIYCYTVGKNLIENKSSNQRSIK